MEKKGEKNNIKTRIITSCQNSTGKTISESLINIMIMFVSFYRKTQKPWERCDTHLMTAIMLSDQLFVIGRNLEWIFFSYGQLDNIKNPSWLLKSYRKHNE